jgi:tetratricopeptide (TPR) repeat protein
MRTLADFESDVRERPHDDAAWRALADTYTHLRRYRDALSCYENARARNPGCAEHWGRAAYVLIVSGRPDDAIAYYEHALVLAPESPRLHVAFGRLLADSYLDDPRTERILTRALELDPTSSGTGTRLARLALLQMSADAAVAYLGARFAGCVPEANIGVAVASALLENGCYESACARFQTCLDVCPDKGPASVGLRLGLAAAQTGLGAVDLARRTYEDAVAAAPMSGRCFVSYIEHLIRLDRLEDAMSASRARAADYALPFGLFRRVPKESARPDWRGEPLYGRTVMLRAESGAGDAVQFARFASLFREQGARVIVETFPNLVRLFETLDGGDVIATPFENVPHVDYDVHPALSGLLFPWTWTSMAARIPYLHPARRRQPPAHLGRSPGLKVGLTWQGAALERDPHRFRAIPLALFAPLARVPGVTLFSLQYGAGAEEVRTAPFPIVAAEPGDFLDTAATVDALDLIVSVDTGTAHVAGAIGKPCAVLLPYRACWRWMSDRDTSPFYPSVRLFRQATPGDWATVIDDVVAALLSGGITTAKVS